MKCPENIDVCVSEREGEFIEPYRSNMGRKQKK